MAEQEHGKKTIILAAAAVAAIMNGTAFALLTADAHLLTRRGR